MGRVRAAMDLAVGGPGQTMHRYSDVIIASKNCVSIHVSILAQCTWVCLCVRETFRCGRTGLRGQL